MQAYHILDLELCTTLFMQPSLRKAMDKFRGKKEEKEETASCQKQCLQTSFGRLDYKRYNVNNYFYIHTEGEFINTPCSVTCVEWPPLE